MGFWDFMYVFGFPLAIATLLFSLFASFWTNHTFKKYSKVHSTRGVTGQQAAEEILRINDLSGSFGNDQSVSVERVAGNLTDHYSPKEKVLRLSDSVYGNTSVAAIGVAAHECGHAIQDSKGFIPNKIRSALVPLANVGSRFGPYMAIIGAREAESDSISLRARGQQDKGVMKLSDFQNLLQTAITSKSLEL